MKTTVLQTVKPRTGLHRPGSRPGLSSLGPEGPLPNDLRLNIFVRQLMVRRSLELIDDDVVVREPGTAIEEYLINS